MYQPHVSSSIVWLTDSLSTIYLSICLSVCLSISVYLSTHRWIYVSMYTSIYVPRSMYLSRQTSMCYATSILRLCNVSLTWSFFMFIHLFLECKTNITQSQLIISLHLEWYLQLKGAQRTINYNYNQRHDLNRLQQLRLPVEIRAALEALFFANSQSACKYEFGENWIAHMEVNIPITRRDRQCSMRLSKCIHMLEAFWSEILDLYLYDWGQSKPQD